MAVDADPSRGAHPRRRSVLALAGVGALALLVLIAWLSRNAVGERLAVDYLRSRGVAATVRLTRVDAGGVAGALTIGPPGAPTLVVERFEADFAPGTVLARKPQVRRLRLVRPRLALRFDGRRLDFGALQPLVDDALHARSSGGVQPDVRIEDGRLRLTTPYGPLDAGIAAALSRGRLVGADLRLPQTTLSSPAGEVEGLAGRATLRGAGGEALAVQAHLSARVLRAGRVGARTVTAEAAGVIPYRAGGRDPFAGRATLHVSATAERAEGAPVQTTQAQAAATLQGDLATAHGFAFIGSGDAAGSAAVARGRGLTLMAPSLRATASRLTLGAGEVEAVGRATATAASGAAPLMGERGRLSVLRGEMTGRLHAARGSLDGQADAGVSATVGFSASAATRLAARAAPGTYGADLRPAIARALRGARLDAPAIHLALQPGAWRAIVVERARVSSGSGGVLTVVGRGGASLMSGGEAGMAGSLLVDLAGGGFPKLRLAVDAYDLRAGAVSATFAGEVSGSAGPLREAALGLAGRLRADAAGARITAAHCLPFRFARFMGDAGAPLATEATGRACPFRQAPMLAFAGRRWKVSARFDDVDVAAPPAKIGVSHAEGAVEVVADAAGRITAAAQIERATIRDTDTPRRFNPLVVSGPAKLANERWSADLAVSLARPAHPLGAIHLTQDQRSGAGALTLAPATIAFAPDGLQPAAVLPALAPLATQVQGEAEVAMALGWKGEATTAAVHVRTAGLQAQTSAGLVRGIATDLTLTSLDPLASLPGQVLTAERVEGVAPLTGLVVTYRLGKDRVEVADARAILAGGRVSLDPMRVDLLPGATISGVVRADGVQMGELLEAVNLSRAVQMEAKIAGALPFSLGPDGLRLTDGRLAATQPGRLTLQRQALTGVSTSGGDAALVGGAGPASIPAPPPQPSAVQDFAFQALEDLAFTELSVDVGSRPQGRVGLVFHIKGRHDPPRAQEARVSLLALLRGKAFDTPIPLPKGTEVNLTLDSSLNLDDLIKAYTGLSAGAGSAEVQP